MDKNKSKKKHNREQETHRITKIFRTLERTKRNIKRAYNEAEREGSTNRVVIGIVSHWIRENVRALYKAYRTLKSAQRARLLT